MKSHKRYWLYRVFAPSAILVWNYVGLRAYFGGDGVPVSMLLLVPVMLPALFMVFSVFVFPLRYSIFGELERAPFPTEKPLLIAAGSHGRIGLLKATVPFFTWTVFPSGLGISILGVGKVMLPATDIDSIDVGHFGATVTHHSPELRSPIRMPKHVAEALRSATARAAPRAAAALLAS